LRGHERHNRRQAETVIRRGVGAVVLPVDRFEAWYAQASQTVGLNAVELGVLAAIRDSYRQVMEKGYGPRLSFNRLAYHLNVDPIHVRWAVYRLRESGLIGVQSGRGGQANAYSMALPKRVAGSMLAAAAEDDVPPI
jgi:hypothetical protein